MARSTSRLLEDRVATLVAGQRQLFIWRIEVSLCGLFRSAAERIEVKSSTAEESIMKRLVGVMMCAVLTVVVLGSGNARAAVCGPPVEVNNIWCNAIINWNNSGKTLCVAEQYNSQTVVVRFDVSPVDSFGHHGTVTATMAPYQFNRIFAWLNGTPNIKCIMTGWSRSGRRHWHRL
jgi:hypothetical protein